MAQLDFQKQVLGTLTEMKRSIKTVRTRLNELEAQRTIDMKKSIETLRKDIDYLVEYIGDTKLTEEERKQLDESIAKISAGDTSDFVSWKEAKKELGI